MFTWLYDETGGSVLLMTVLHASVTTGGILYLAGGGAALQTELPNALYAAVFLFAALAVVAAYGPERLADVEVPTASSGPKRSCRSCNYEFRASYRYSRSIAMVSPSVKERSALYRTHYPQSTVHGPVGTGLSRRVLGT
jgi:hypothetical protein